jgi:hypothetical protein
MKTILTLLCVLCALAVPATIYLADHSKLDQLTAIYSLCISTFALIIVSIFYFRLTR